MTAARHRRHTGIALLAVSLIALLGLGGCGDVATGGDRTPAPTASAGAELGGVIEATLVDERGADELPVPYEVVSSSPDSADVYLRFSAEDVAGEGCVEPRGVLLEETADDVLIAPLARRTDAEACDTILHESHVELVRLAEPLGDRQILAPA